MKIIDKLIGRIGLLFTAKVDDIPCSSYTETIIDRHFHGTNKDLENWSRTVNHYSRGRLVHVDYEEQNSTECDKGCSSVGFKKE